MRLFKAIKIFGILLMVAIVINFFGCGEDEEMPVKPEISDSSAPVAGEQAGDLPGDPAEIVWIEIEDDGGHRERKEIEFSDPLQEQNVIVVKVKDADGNPVPDIRVEWILNTWPGAVGDIIETDDPGHRDVPAAPNPEAAPQIKVDNKFALTFTNSERETPPQLKGLGPNGTDITIEEGETWIVITSVAEGDTDITAFAPAIPRDKRHKIFAIKYWTDIKLIPPPTKLTCINYCLAPLGENEEKLVSRVIKTLDGSPLPGIKVRYTIKPGGPRAVWDENNRTTIEVTSNDKGEAPATIKLVSPLPGPSPVIPPNTITVEYFRPPREGEGDVRVASQDVTKEWGSAFLSIAMPCPKGSGTNGSFGVCDEVTFDITVENKGDCAAENVKVTLEYPSEAFDLVQPPDSVEYLPSGRSAQVSATLTAKKVGTWPVRAKAESAKCVYAEVDTPCILDVKPNLVLKCEETEVITEYGVQPYIYPDTIELEIDSYAPKKKEATITLVVENKCSYDVEGDYDLTVTLPEIVRYVIANPTPDKSPPYGESGGKITWNTSTIKPGDNQFTFTVEGTDSGIRKITAKLSKVNKPLTCEFPIKVEYICQLTLTGGAPFYVAEPTTESLTVKFETTKGEVEEVEFRECIIQKESPPKSGDWVDITTTDEAEITSINYRNVENDIDIPYHIGNMRFGKFAIFDIELIVEKVDTPTYYRCKMIVSYRCGKGSGGEFVLNSEVK